MQNTISAEEINKLAKNPAKFIAECEASFDKKISDIKDYIRKNNKEYIFISGPTSSGKTTFTKKLSQGFPGSLIISLDDYYKTLENMPRRKDGRYNFESVNSIDLETIKKDFKKLIKGEEIFLPGLDFQTKKRSLSETGVKKEKDTLVIIEGLHALNPKIFEGFENSLKIFISPMTELQYNGKKANPYDLRFIRRLVRDRFFRDAKAEINIKMWPDVRAGEKIYMKKYRENADFLCDTFIPYELCVLKPWLIWGLSHLEKTPRISRLLSIVSEIEEISSDKIPETSLLKEFIK